MKIPSRGFTLLEVLVALAIIAIAITALLQSSSHDIENSTILKNKTLANRLIINTANKIQAELISPPYPPYEHVETVDMANQSWRLVCKRFKHNDQLDRIQIEVSVAQTKQSLATLTFLRRKL